VEAFCLLEVQLAGRDKICIHFAGIVPLGNRAEYSGQPIALECFGGVLILKAAKGRMCKVPFLAPTAKAETPLPPHVSLKTSAPPGRTRAPR
jgi:hypothetical protein